MKLVIVVAFLFLPTVGMAFDKAFTNDSGFVTCYQSKANTYFFEWDPFINTKVRAISYFKIEDYVHTTGHFIRGCDDRQYLLTIPSQILKPIQELQNLVPSRVLKSLDQIANGANQFYFENSAAEYIHNRADKFRPDQPEVLSQLRYTVGDKFASEVMSLFIQKTIPNKNSCENLVGTCDFYLCQEKLNPCGLEGYNLSFGYKYCSGSKFELLDQMKSAEGKTWVSNVFQCLQKKSLQNKLNTSRNSCDAIATDSFDSHAGCYVKAGFCELKGSELVSIFKLIKKEVFSAQTISQSVEILKRCSPNL